MKANSEHHNAAGGFVEDETLARLAHYLPSQAPLKDLVHRNTLRAFQNHKFEEGTRMGAEMFGYKVSLTIDEYRQLYKDHRIREDVLEDRIIRRKGEKEADKWINKLFHKKYDSSIHKRIKALRAAWKTGYGLDLDRETHGRLFKILGAYLDQGISIWDFPLQGGLLESVRALEKESFGSFFKTERARRFLFDAKASIKNLLEILVDQESLYEQYLFDQQFSHPGWSGLVSVIENEPHTLLDRRQISLKETVLLECLFEIDALDARFGQAGWKPLALSDSPRPKKLFEPFLYREEYDVLTIWQEAFEWSYYDQVLAGIVKMKGANSKKEDNSFQAVFCIDDREGSIRRHLENIDLKCETYGTPGFFGVEFYYQPVNGAFHTKVCPITINPKYLIKEVGSKEKIENDLHFSKKTHHPVWALASVMTIGFLSAFRLFVNIFKPSLSPAASTSFSHMGASSRLTVEHDGSQPDENGLQIGFTVIEMADRVENVLKSMGLVSGFSRLVYIIGHGASSINNTHYADYDCGACSGRPGSVNARAFSFMANHAKVRALLAQRGIVIPDETQFLGGLHDTTRDEFVFYDQAVLSPENALLHAQNLPTFKKALDINAKERARRFMSIDSKQSPEKIHRLILERSVSLFEPRPELNHATNALCIVGRHSLHEGLFLDRRAFSNSYDYRLDPGGELLSNILDTATPVCGGINLEYFFARTDNQKLGSGSKLPHNVIGLIGVANGVDGDLRPGLAEQMIEVHDPIRLLMIVEHYPDTVLAAIQKSEATYEWYINEWINLVAIHPDTYEVYVFKDGAFSIYKTLKHLLDTIREEDMDTLFESDKENFPVYLIKK